MPVANHCAKHFVTVGEDVRRHHDLFAHSALDGESPSFDLGLDAADHDARRSRGRQSE